MYGITETTVHSTAQFLDESFIDHRASVIGRPLPHLGIHLLDREQRPVADGEVGEIYVSGAGVARGYHGRPALTAERFTTTAAVGRRTYRSGDLARRAADGTLEYLGRADAQVKVRGFRVEPGEIEACMLGYPGMRQVVIVPRQGDPDGRLVAYFVADDEIDVPAIRSFLGRRLPEFMVPAFFRRVSSIPLTINGKVDRGALPQLETVDGAGDPPALDGVAAKLAAIWGQVLGVPTVGIDQDFFTVGGDSLTAIRAVKRCRAEGVNVKIADLYQHTTIRGLTAFLESDAA
jgi:acyl-coenzyme A synthetase/AMP-(fatty) acid ligase/aryl carrier-like protein